jgi:hypothetical protein
MPTLYSLVSRILSSAVPVIAMDPDMPMRQGPDGVWTGLYWSRALATTVAVGLGPASVPQAEESTLPDDLLRLLSAGEVPDLIEDLRERNPGQALGTSRGWQRQIPWING